MTIIKRLLFGIVLLLLAMTILIYTLGYTSAGLTFTLKMVTRFVPGKLSIQQAEGCLFKRVALNHLIYTDKNQTLTLQHIDVDWRPKALLNGILFINSLNVNKAMYRYQQTAEVNSSFDWHTLSKLTHLNIQEARIQDVQISNEKQTVFKLDKLLLKQDQDGVNHIALNIFNGDIEGTYTLFWSPNLNWQMALTVKNLDLSKILNKWEGQAGFILSSKGEWGANNQKMRLEIRDLNGSFAHYPLKGSANLAIDNGFYSISNTHFTIANSTLALLGNVDKKWDIKWQLNVPKLSSFVPSVTGLLMSAGTIQGPRKSPQIEAALKGTGLAFGDYKIDHYDGKLVLDSQNQKLSQAQLKLTNVDLSGYVLPKLDTHIQGKLIDNQLSAEFAIVSSPQNTVHGDFVLPHFTNLYDLSQSMKVALKFKLTDIERFIQPNSVINHLKGVFEGNLNLQGSIQHPSITGNYLLTNAQFNIPSLGIQISRLSLQGLAKNAGVVPVTGKFYSQGKSADVHGEIQLADLALKLNIKGANLQAVHLPEYKIDISPDVVFTLDKNGMALNGTVNVPYAEIVTKDLGSVVTLPDEIVFVGKKKPVEQAPLNLAMHLKLMLGEHIHLVYGGLNAAVNGSLVINQDANKLPTAVGELSFKDGYYRAYGKQLKLKESRIIYTGGPLSNPSLNIRAAKKVKTISFNEDISQFKNNTNMKSYAGESTITIGVHVTGVASHPLVELYSSPANLSQGDILSYLVLGFPRSQASGQQVSMIMTALSAMNTGGNQAKITGISDKISKLFGLEDIGFDSTEIIDPKTNGVKTATTVGVGKKLFNNLYIHYSMGIFNPVSIVNLRYKINKRLSIQSESSSVENGVDLLYGFEQD